MRQKVGSLPIVDEKGVLVDVLRKKDITRAIVLFARQATAELFNNLCYQTIGETVEGRAERKNVAPSRLMLTPSDTVAKALQCFGSADYRHKRVYIVNDNAQLIGSVALLAFAEFLLHADRKPSSTASAGFH